MLLNNNTNQNNSLIKTEIDNWYENYLIDYSDYLEDVIFCGERSIKDSGGWVLNQGSFNNSLVFSGGEDNSLFCQNVINQFSTKNEKALLSYPISLMNVSEMRLLNYISLRKTNANYWLLSPFQFGFYSSVYYVSGTGGVANSNVSYEYGIRPSVSLKPGTTYRLGDGSKNNPYIIE
jgi:hypothetical protein